VSGYGTRTVVYLALCSSDVERFWREDGVVDHYVNAVPDYHDVSWSSL